MFEPCFEHCYIKFGKSYTTDCDDKCAYAVLVKENKKLAELLNEKENIIKNQAREEVAKEIFKDIEQKIGKKLFIDDHMRTYSEDSNVSYKALAEVKEKWINVIKE